MSILMQWNEDALVRSMSSDGTKPGTDDCRKTSVRFLAGSGVTDATGSWVMKVADAVCEQVGLVGAVSFVATATFNPVGDGPGTDSPERPSWVMTGHTQSGGYVTLYVRSYDCNCGRLPGVPFDYHVAISYDFVT